MLLANGTRLGPYEIVGPLGAGGMGQVYKARDPRLDRIVAIKVSLEQFTERFEREARAVAALNHPHICQIYDVGPTYIVMEYVPGHNLKGPLPLDQVLKYAAQVCDALDAAHSRNITHRDLKPANIIVGKSGIKLLDFGLAKMGSHPDSAEADVTASVNLTANHAIVGTLQYMAPEQLEGKPVDARSDIFAFGAVLYEMITGRRAFDGSSQASVIAAIMERESPSVAGAAPAPLEQVVRRCLAKNPDERWQSARDLKYELEQIASSGSGLKPASGPATALLAPRRRVSWMFSTALVLVLAAVGAGVFWFGRGGKQSNQSIAVLPFADLSPEKNQEYFSDGLAEELLNGLARIPGWHVAGRTSSFRFKGDTADSRTIGQKLNVTTILEGSVRKQGNRARISVQLIHASDGFQLWSATFDRDMDDIFAVEAEIARAVAGALGALDTAPASPAAKNTTGEAYNAYLQGRYFLQRGNRENYEKAATYFERAIQLAPGYAPGWTGLGAARLSQANWGYVPVDDGYRKAREAIQHALALDPRSGEATASLGTIKMFYDWDFAGAGESFRRALELEPANPDALFNSGALARIENRFDEAIAFHLRDIQIDPLNPTAYHDYGLTLHYAGRQKDAKTALLKSLELSPELENAHALLSRIALVESQPQQALSEIEKESHEGFRLSGLPLVYHALGRRKESDASLAELLAKYSKNGPYQIAAVYAFRGEKDRAFEWLDRAYAEHDAGITEMKTDPLLVNLHGDDRYKAMLSKMHLSGELKSP
jgi:TolB-like protein/tRNA A-37 threonylcarbamoyl transferase component Bud32/Tfp pilus assembly protein PilF